MTSTLGRSTRTPADRSYLSIREVLDLLIDDFPDVTISKIRFLEARGLIHPERTPSGYRKFYKNDVDRLRWILRQQRENYLPLNVIKVRLDGGELCEEDGREPSLFEDSSFADDRTPPPIAADAEPDVEQGSVPGRHSHPAEGLLSTRRFAPRSDTPALRLHSSSDAPSKEIEAVVPETAVATATVTAPLATNADDTGPPVAPRRSTEIAKPGPSEPTSRVARRASGVGYTAEELARAVGATPGFISEIASFGLITGREVAGEYCYDDGAANVARVAHTFAGFGIEPRHLKSLQHAAFREAELFAQAVLPLLLQRNPESRHKAQTDLSELMVLGVSFKSAFVQSELRKLTGA